MTATGTKTPSASKFVIGKYRLLAELGRGGMATAYLAAAQGPGGFNKLVVVKKLRASLAAEDEFLKMFLDEARLAARISHPNIVQTHEVGIEPGNCYIAMEYLDGQAFETVLRRAAKRESEMVTANTESSEAREATATPTSAVPLRIQLHIVSNVLAGLEHAHELKNFDGSPLSVVHRDVSPHNVMITYDGHVKLLDFGIAKAADSSNETRTGVMKGKCAYMPSEQFGGKNIDRRADIFAVGVILWQALTGRRLWLGLSDAEIFQKVAMGSIPAPSSIQPTVQPDLEAIALKALALNREDRYASAAEMQAALDAVIAADTSLSASAKDLSKYLSELFAADRVRLTRIVEEALNAPRADGILNLATGARASSVVVPEASGTDASTTILESDAHAASRKRLLIYGVIGLGAIAVIFGAALYKPAVPSLSEPAPSIAPSPTLPQERGQASFTLSAKPASARIFLDGRQMTSNPAVVIVPNDGKLHIARAEAEGYVAAEESIPANQAAVSRELLLVPALALPSASTTTSSATGRPASPIVALKPTASAPPTAATAPPSASPTASTTSRHGPVDHSDPWLTVEKKL